MDWKILVGVVLFLVSFSVFRMCTDDAPKSHDEVVAQQREQVLENQREASQRETSRARTRLEQAARERRGDVGQVEHVVLETNDFRAEITTLGAALRRFELKDEQYMEPPRDWATGEQNTQLPVEPIDLVTTNPSEKYWMAYPLRLHFYEGLDGLLPDANYRVVRRSDTEVLLRYEQEDQPVVIEKKFQVAKPGAPYQLWLTIRIQNIGDRAVSFRPGIMQTGFQPESEARSGMFAPQPNLQTASCNGALNGFVQRPLDDMDSPHVDTGVLFAAVGNNYFVNAMMPYGDYPASCKLTADPGIRVMYAIMKWGEIDLNPGEDVILQVNNYMGPKKYQVLQQVGRRLEETTDYGILEPICKVLLWLMLHFHAWVGNWGLAIILLTISIKLLLIPLTNKSFKSSNAMKALKPEMDKINEEFKDDPQKKQQAIMAMYKAKGVNPLGGCLPMLLQMPIWFALFRTLRSSPELYRAPFFGWITDLSNADPYFITPVIMGGLMFLQQRMMPMGTDNAQMKMMMYMMPIMFTVMMVFLPSGLTLYIMVNTILSILHQWILQKRSQA